MVNVKGRYKAHGSEQQEFCIFKKQKKQKGEGRTKAVSIKTYDQFFDEIGRAHV